MCSMLCLHVSVTLDMSGLTTAGPSTMGAVDDRLEVGAFNCATTEGALSFIVSWG